MGYALIGALAFIYIGLTLINRMLEGAFLTSADIAIFNNLTVFRTLDLGWINIPYPNISFFTSGIPHLLKWDYSFFGGNAQIFQYLLYSITVAVVFIVFVTIIGILYNLFRSRV